MLISPFQEHCNTNPVIQCKVVQNMIALRPLFLPEISWGCSSGTAGKKVLEETFSRPLSRCSSLRKTYAKMYFKCGFDSTLSLFRVRSWQPWVMW